MTTIRKPVRVDVPEILEEEIRKAVRGEYEFLAIRGKPGRLKTTTIDRALKGIPHVRGGSRGGAIGIHEIGFYATPDGYRGDHWDQVENGEWLMETHRNHLPIKLDDCDWILEARNNEVLRSLVSALPRTMIYSHKIARYRHVPQRYVNRSPIIASFNLAPDREGPVAAAFSRATRYLEVEFDDKHLRASAARFHKAKQEVFDLWSLCLRYMDGDLRYYRNAILVFVANGFAWQEDILAQVAVPTRVERPRFCEVLRVIAPHYRTLKMGAPLRSIFLAYRSAGGTIPQTTFYDIAKPIIATAPAWMEVAPGPAPESGEPERSGPPPHVGQQVADDPGSPPATDAAPEPWWVVLGVKQDAKVEEIEATYRKLAQRFHPDKFMDDEDFRRMAEEKMKRITAARDEALKGAETAAAP